MVNLAVKMHVSPVQMCVFMVTLPSDRGLGNEIKQENSEGMTQLTF